MYGDGRPMAQRLMLILFFLLSIKFLNKRTFIFFRYAEYPQDGVPVVRRQEAPPQSTQGINGGQKTKYGDTWEI